MEQGQQDLLVITGASHQVAVATGQGTSIQTGSTGANGAAGAQGATGHLR